MTTCNDVLTKVRDYIYQHFPLAQQRTLSDTDSLLASGVVDSMGVLDLVAFLEESFSIVVSDDEMLSDNFESITTIATYVSVKAGLPTECVEP